MPEKGGEEAPHNLSLWKVQFLPQYQTSPTMHFCDCLPNWGQKQTKRVPLIINPNLPRSYKICLCTEAVQVRKPSPTILSFFNILAELCRWLYCQMMKPLQLGGGERTVRGGRKRGAGTRRPNVTSQNNNTQAAISSGNFWTRFCTFLFSGKDVSTELHWKGILSAESRQHSQKATALQEIKITTVRFDF